MKSGSITAWGIVVFWMSMAQPLLAAPFEQTFRFQQPDGRGIELWGRGDEFHAVFETLDGYSVVFNSQTKAYEFAQLSADGNELVPSGIQVGKGRPESLGMAKHLRIHPEAARKNARALHQRWDKGVEVERRWKELKAKRRRADLKAAGKSSARTLHSFPTNIVGLCLLIDFDDEPATIPRADIVDFCNGDGFAGYGQGSVRKYFQDVSTGLMIYSNVVTAYIRIPSSLHSKSWYCDVSKDSGEQANLLIRDAIAIMTNLPNYETEILPAFDSLTVDRWTNVVAANVFYTGEAGGVWRKGLWPHAWYLSPSEKLSPNGKKLFAYQISDMGDTLRLGTFCHENGHMIFGFPDLYDYEYDSTGGAGYFSLMGYGSAGAIPPQVDAYLKWAAGWATTLPLTRYSNLTATLSISGGVNSNRFYRYDKPGSTTEYFLIENRQQTNWDSNLPASGLAIWHVDELGERDNQSVLTNSAHANYELTLVQADNLFHFQNNMNGGDSNDLYFRGNTAIGYGDRFSDRSLPGATWWDGSPSYVNFHDFSSNGVEMTFSVEQDSEPVAFRAVLDGPSQIDLTWGNNASNDEVMVAWNTTATFGTPSGPYAVGDSISGGGTVLYCGSANQVSHDGLASATPYYYKAWSVRSGFRYSIGDPCSAITPHPLPFIEDFEHAGDMPLGWSQETETGEARWESQTGGIYSCGPTNAHGGNYNALLAIQNRSDNITKLIPPPINFGTNTWDATLTFWHCMQVWWFDQDTLRVLYKTSKDRPWNLLATYTNSVASWTLQTISLPEPGGEYYIAFEGNAQYGLGVCLDDITVRGSPLPLVRGMVSSSAVNVRENGEARFFVKLDQMPPMETTVTVARVDGDPDIAVNSGVELIFAATNWQVWQAVTLEAADDTDATNGTATIQIAAPGGATDVVVTELEDDIGPNWALAAGGGTISGTAAVSPSRLIDGIHTDRDNYGYTVWTNVPPGSMTLDLHATTVVTRVRVLNWDWDNQVQRYTIESSLDGTTWTNQLVDASEGEHVGWEDWPIASQPARYLRLTGLSNSANANFCIAEWEVYEGNRSGMVLSVTPSNRAVFAETGTVTFSITNTGGGTMAYTTSESESWLSLTNGESGGNSGTLAVSYDANLGAISRTGMVTVSASGALGSPVNVTVVQAGVASSVWDEGYQSIGGGWRRLSWFGDYVPMGNDGWIWHNKHGFFFVAADGTPQSLWLFANDQGWLWTSSAIYPFLYRSDPASWLWYSGSSNPRWLMNMTTSQWETWP